MSEITIFGDSVMKGVEYLNGRYQLSSMRFLPDWLNCRNRSHIGITSLRGLQIVERTVPQLNSGDVALIEYGGNDSDFNWDEIALAPQDEHLPKVSVDKFESALRSMVELLRDHGVCPVLMTLPPLDPYKYFDFISAGRNAENILHWLGRKEVIYTFQEQYTLAICRTCRQLDTGLIDVRAEFLKNRDFLNLLSDDGIHPNDAGHRLITETIEHYLRERKTA